MVTALALKALAGIGAGSGSGSGAPIPVCPTAEAKNTARDYNFHCGPIPHRPMALENPLAAALLAKPRAYIAIQAGASF